MEVVRDRHGEVKSVSGKEEDEQSKMFEGKLKRFKKTDQVCPKHAIFATESSRMQVARTSHQNT